MPVFHSEDEASDSSKSDRDCSDEDDNYEEEEEVDDDDDDEMNNQKLFKPVFIKKENRITIKEKEIMIINEKKLNEIKQKQLNDRKQHTRVLVAETIRKNNEDEQVSLYIIVSYVYID